MTLPDAAARAEGRAGLPLLVFLSLMMSVVAMTIDAVLPALDSISADLAFADPNDRQLIVVLVVAGLGLSQIVFGPLADGLGRRPATMIGYAVFAAGSLLCLVATEGWMMLAGRFLQGLGAGGPRLVAVAIVRDLYEGRPMARIMSLVLTVFMLVPILAPMIGQAVEQLAGWQAIFGLYLGMAALSAGWYLLAVPETLTEPRPLSLGPVARAFGEVLRTRVTMCYTASATCIFGAFFAYLATAQQVLEEMYALGPLFPVVFGAMAVLFAGATFANSALVMRMGMRRLCLIALTVMVSVSALAAVVSGLGPWEGLPPLPLYLAMMGAIFSCIAILFGNFNALAMQPLGHMAGTGSAVVNAVTSLGAAGLGAAIARGLDGSVTPLFLGFLCLGALGLVAMRIAETGRG